MKYKPRRLYFCTGCRQVHNDNDYCKEDGDLLITDLSKFLKSVEMIMIPNVTIGGESK